MLSESPHREIPWEVVIEQTCGGWSTFRGGRHGKANGGQHMQSNQYVFMVHLGFTANMHKSIGKAAAINTPQ